MGGLFRYLTVTFRFLGISSIKDDAFFQFMDNTWQTFVFFGTMKSHYRHIVRYIS